MNDTVAHPPPPWPPSANHNSQRAGWEFYFAGKAREDCPFPRDRRDLKDGYESGWDAAKAFVQDTGPLEPATGGWPAAVVVVELSHATSEQDAAASLCRASRQLQLGCGGVYKAGAPPMVAWPHQEPANVLAEWDRRCTDQPPASVVRAGEAQLWIDGRAFVVPMAVFGHVKHLADLVQQLVARIERADGTVELLRAGAPEPPATGRWTATIKTAVVLAVKRGHLVRDRALAIYQISDDELRQWEASHGAS